MIVNSSYFTIIQINLRMKCWRNVHEMLGKSFCSLVFADFHCNIQPGLTPLCQTSLLPSISQHTNIETESNVNMVPIALFSSFFLHFKASVIHTPAVMSPSVALDLSATSVCVSECTICPLWPSPWCCYIHCLWVYHYHISHTCISHH